MYVTRRNLLEWVSAAQVRSGLRLDLRGFYGRMAGAVALAGGAASAVAWLAPQTSPVALAVLLLWVASPGLARWISLPSARGGDAGTVGQRCACPAADRAPDVAVLRHLRGARSTTGCLRTTSRRTRARSSPTGRRPRISGSTCCPRWPRATSAGSGRWTRWPGSRPRSTRWAASSASAATSTTGTTRASAARSTRSTCRRSTAATSPGTSWPSPMPVGR